MTVPIIHYDQRKASDAFEAHAAMLRAEQATPALRGNPAWIMRRQDAYERFEAEFLVNTWRCGHDRTPENTKQTDLGPRCATCRREIERRAAKRYRQRRKA